MEIEEMIKKTPLDNYCSITMDQIACHNRTHHFFTVINPAEDGLQGIEAINNVEG